MRASRKTRAKKLKFGKLKRKRAAVIRQNFSTDPKPEQKIALEKTVAAPISIELEERRDDDDDARVLACVRACVCVCVCIIIPSASYLGGMWSDKGGCRADNEMLSANLSTLRVTSGKPPRDPGAGLSSPSKCRNDRESEYR